MPWYGIMHEHEEAKWRESIRGDREGSDGIMGDGQRTHLDLFSGEHLGIIVAEANSREPFEAFAANIGLREATVLEADRMRFPD